MFYKKIIMPAFLAALLLCALPAQAQQLSATHSLVAEQESEMGLEYIYQISITNNGTMDIANINLLPMPETDIFVVDIQRIVAGAIPAGSTVTVQWTLTVSLPLEIFQQSVFRFMTSALQTDNVSIESTLVSNTTVITN